MVIDHFNNGKGKFLKLNYISYRWIYGQIKGLQNISQQQSRKHGKNDKET